MTPSPGPACPGTVTTPTPVVCIPAGSGEDQPAPVGTDGFLEFAAQVVNNGPAVSDASIVVALPSGLGLESDEDDPVIRYEDWWSSDSEDDGTALGCTVTDNGSTVTCPTGSVPAGANFLVVIDLVALDDAVTGATGTFHVTLESTSDPATFPTTSVPGTVDFVGTAHLQVKLTPAKATVVVGQSLTLVATVHNVGPNTAVEAAAVGLVFADNLDTPPFLITNSAPFPDGDSGSSDASAAAFAVRALPARVAPATSAPPSISPPASPIGYWPIGTIAPGDTETVHVVVKAGSVGQAELDFDAGSADESCDDGTATGCENTAAAELTAVAPPTTTAAPTTTASAAGTTSTTPETAISAAGSSPETVAALPNTGFGPGPWLGWAGVVIALGIGLIMLGAPRRRVSGRYR